MNDNIKKLESACSALRAIAGLKDSNNAAEALLLAVAIARIELEKQEEGNVRPWGIKWRSKNEI